MIAPNKDRFDYGKQLNAPPGYELASAVATTYTLDLQALLAVSVALGFQDTLEGDLSGEKLLLLESIMHMKDKLRVFYQQGKITLPKEYNYLFTLLEPCLHPIVPDQAYASFHPKVWLLRYKAIDEKKPKICYRLIVLTRNLTFDKSWDLAASLEGELTNELQSNRSQSEWIDFFLSLVEGDADFGVGEVFEKELPLIKWKSNFGKNLKLLPGSEKYKKPLSLRTADKVMVVSPFLKDAGGYVKALDWLNDTLNEPSEKFLFSRAEELNAIGKKKLEHWKCFSINPEVVDGLDKINEGTQSYNLHAKLIVTENEINTDWHLGSANITSAALGSAEKKPRNTEFMLRFTGKTEIIGIDVLLDEFLDEEDEGLFIPHKFESIDTEVDSKHDDIRKKMFELLAAEWLLSAYKVKGSDLFEVELKVLSKEVEEMILDENIHVKVSLISNIGKRETLNPIMKWQDVKLIDISAFISLQIYIDDMIESDAETYIMQVVIEHIEDGDTRQENILKEMLNSDDKILNYITMLLNPDATKNDWLSQDIGISYNSSEIDPLSSSNPMFEQLMLTVSRHKEALYRIERLVSSLEENNVVIPETFSKLWSVFRKEIENDE